MSADSNKPQVILSSGITPEDPKKKFGPTVPTHMGYDQARSPVVEVPSRADLDSEIDAMRAVAGALENLDQVTQRRILSWVVKRYKLEL